MRHPCHINFNKPAFPGLLLLTDRPPQAPYSFLRLRFQFKNHKVACTGPFIKHFTRYDTMSQHPSKFPHLRSSASICG